MEISSIKRDSATIAEGRWIEEIPGFGDLRLKVRGLSSPTVLALRARKERKVPFEDRERDGQLTADAATRLMCELLHEGVLLDWEGLTENGVPVKYDPDLAKVWLTDPDFRHFADAVSYAAGVVDRTKAKQAEDMAGNSEAPLPTK